MVPTWAFLTANKPTNKKTLNHRPLRVKSYTDVVWLLSQRSSYKSLT